MLNGIEGIMNLAAASGEDLASVSDIVTDALTAFGLTAADSGHFADVLAKASSNANTNVGLMGATFKYVAPVAGAMKYSIEDTSIAIGLMANAGIKGEQAGTALRSMLTRLVKPPKMAADALNELGFSAVNADGSMKPLRQVISELRERFSNLTESEKASYAASIAGTEAMSGFLSIMNASENDVNKLTTAVDNANGAAAEMAETMNDNLKGQMTILGSSIEGLGIKIYDKFENPLKKAAKTAVESVGKISKSMTNGELSESVDQIAESTGRFMSKVAELAAQGLPKLINGFVLVTSHAREIIGVLGAAAAAVGIFKAAMVLDKAVKAWAAASTAVHIFNMGMAGANATLSITQLTVGVLTGQMKLATAAHMAWNTVISMNPIGLLVTAITAATAALVIFASTQKDEQTAVEKTSERIKDEVAALEEEIRAREALKEAKEKAISTATAEIDHISLQAEKLNDLVDATGKVKDKEEARAKVLAEQINKVIPNAVSWSEKEGKMYLQVADNLQALIAQKRINALIEAGEEEYNNALANQARLTQEAVDAKRNLTNAEAELAQAKKAYYEAEKNGSEGMRTQAMMALKTAESNLAQQERIYEERKNAAKDCFETIDSQEKLLIAAQEGDTEKINTILEERLSGLKQYGADNATEAKRQYAEKRDAYLEAEEILKNDQSQAAQDMLAKMKKQADDAKVIAENAGVDIAQLNQIYGKKAMDALAQGHEEGKTAVTAVAEAVMNDLKSTLNKQGEMVNIGAFLMQGLAAGIEANADTVYNKAAGVALKVMGTFTGVKAFNEHSPSKWAFGVGKFLDEGLANGISAGLSVPVRAASSMAQKVMKGITGRLSTENGSMLYRAIGANVAKDIAVGIQYNSDTAVGAMERLAGKILSTGDALSTGILSKSKETNTLVYDNLYGSVMSTIDLYYKERDKKISFMNEGTEENIKAVQREVKETEKATDLKIKLYQQEYRAKMQLVDDETSEILDGLQAELDAIDKQEEKKQRQQEEAEYNQKMQELYTKLQIADAEEKQGIIAEIDRAEAERKKVLDKQALEAKKENIRQQMEEARKEAVEKKKLLQEELEEKEYQLQQQRAAELEYMNTVIALMESQVEKKKELSKLQEELVKAQAQQESDELARAKEAQTQKNETELEKQEKEQKEKKRQETQNTITELEKQILELKNSITDSEIVLREKVKNAQMTEEEITGIVEREAAKRKAVEGIGITFNKEGISDKEVQAITTKVQENIIPVVVPVELQQSSVQTTQSNVLRAVSEIQPQVSPVEIPITLGEIDRKELDKLDVTIHNAIEVNMEEQNTYAITADTFMEQWSVVPGWYLETVTNPMSVAVSNLGKDMETTFQRTIKNIQDTVRIMPTWTQRFFFSPLTAGFKSWSNGLIQMIEGVANSGVSAINELINRLNSIRIEPPDWLKEEGYEDWRISISTVSGISIPRLAKGGVIPPNKERLFIAGDNRRENEIIAPESTISRLVKMELDAAEERRQRQQELFQSQKLQAMFLEMQEQIRSISFAPVVVQQPQESYATNHYDSGDYRMTVNIHQPVQSPAQLRRTLERMSRGMAQHG